MVRAPERMEAHMNRIVLIAYTCWALVGAAFAQSQPLPADLQGLPDEIKTLQWQNVNVNTIPAIDHARALLFMNHALDELNANATAEADLMSTYIEKNNLGSQFANTPPPPSPKQLEYPDMEK